MNSALHTHAYNAVLMRHVIHVAARLLIVPIAAHKQTLISPVWKHMKLQCKNSSNWQNHCC